MYSSFQLGWRYTRYRFSAFNGKGHGMHSPFVFSFITHLLNDDRRFYAYRQIEELRETLLRNRETFSAGNRDSFGSAKFGQLLFRMVDYYAPATILELGTSVGIDTAYLASARKQSAVVTIEQNDIVTKFARDHFKKLLLDNIRLAEGDFDDLLPGIIRDLQKIDMVLVRGSYNYTSTIGYYRQLLPAVHESSIVIFDGIHRSAETERAWDEIRKEESVTLSIDLFSMGMIFFRKEQKVKQHFAIRF